MSSAKWRPFCLGPNVLTRDHLGCMETYITFPDYTENQPLTTISVSWQLGANGNDKFPWSREYWKDMAEISKGAI